MPKIRWWLVAWAALAVLTAVPAGKYGYDRVKEVTRSARERLIIQHDLWEQDRGYQGSPRTWTRVASVVLTDRQLMRRVRAKYGDMGIQVELEYRRDLTIAQVEAAAVVFGVWALPLAALLALGYGLTRARRRTAPAAPPPPRPASYDDARYRP